jgi:hypothetical protein
MEDERIKYKTLYYLIEQAVRAAKEEMRCGRVII